VSLRYFPELVSPTPPVLYLNRGIDGLQQLILSENAKLERRRQRDMIGAQIARYVANALFRAATEQVSADEFGGRPDGPAGHVFSSVCEAVAAQLTSTETVNDLYEAVLMVRDGTFNGPKFWADVDLALDRMTARRFQGPVLLIESLRNRADAYVPNPGAGVGADVLLVQVTHKWSQPDNRNTYF
jgi:hypothetical protein